MSAFYFVEKQDPFGPFYIIKLLKETSEAMNSFSVFFATLLKSFQRVVSFLFNMQDIVLERTSGF